MSVLLKKPFIITLIESLSEEQLLALSGKINSSTVDKDFTVKEITNADIGCQTVIMHFSNYLTRKGFLVYKDASHCGFIGYDNTVAGSDFLPLYKINPSTGVYTPVEEKLTADEFRNVIDDIYEGGGSGPDIWVRKMKEAMEVNSADKVEIYDPVIIDENTEIEGNLYITNGGFAQTNQLKVNNITFFDTPEGQSPAVNIVNADLKIGTSGQTKKIYLNGSELGGGGTKLYKHTITGLATDWTIELIDNNATPIESASYPSTNSFLSRNIAAIITSGSYQGNIYKFISCQNSASSGYLVYSTAVSTPTLERVAWNMTSISDTVTAL